jgi:hypothetical protein
MSFEGKNLNYSRINMVSISEKGHFTTLIINYIINDIIRILGKYFQKYSDKICFDFKI